MRKKEIHQQVQWNAKVSLFAWAYIPLIFTLIGIGLLAFYGLMYQTGSKTSAGILATMIVFPLFRSDYVYPTYQKFAHKDFEVAQGREKQ